MTCYAPRIATSAVRKLTTKLYDMLQPTSLLTSYFASFAQSSLSLGSSYFP